MTPRPCGRTSFAVARSGAAAEVTTMRERGAFLKVRT